MSRKRKNISPKKLHELYIKKKLSPYKIGDLLNCSFKTVTNRLKEYNIPTRTKAQAKMKYFKKDFSGDDIEKAYLIGFRLGDLNAYVPYKNSEIIVVRCHTTDKVQIDLMKLLFAKYGQVTVSQSKHGSHVNCYLNKSFSFLLPKQDKIEDWIKTNNMTSCAFAAGYIDAEGNFIINQGRARFKIDSYDKNILKWIDEWLKENNIISKFRLISKKGDSRGNGIVFNNDLWRLNVNEAVSLLELIDFIFPYLKHEKRKKDVLLMKKNIFYRGSRKEKRKGS
jgi:hypothetical protein